LTGEAKAELKHWLSKAKESTLKNQQQQQPRWKHQHRNSYDFFNKTHKTNIVSVLFTIHNLNPTRTDKWQYPKNVINHLLKQL